MKARGLEFCLLGALCLAGCSSSAPNAPASVGGSAPLGGSAGSGGAAGLGGAATAGGAGQGSGGLILTTAGTAGETTSGGAEACAGDQSLIAIVRDFRGYDVSDVELRHPDFEGEFTGFPGIVQAQLGADGTPTYAAAAATPATTGPAEFAQWYRDVDGVNQRFEVPLPLVEDATRPGMFVYDNQEFFPIDGMGFDDGFAEHNFHFTTELHFDFTYLGGEAFLFRGDDDVWVYINGHLVIDLGGVHPAEEGTVTLDEKRAELGITPGNKYRMDIFQAERHTDYSTFRIETSLRCIKNVVVVK